MSLVSRLRVVLGKLRNNFIAFHSIHILKVSFEAIQALGCNHMNVLGRFRDEAQCFLRIRVRTHERGVARNVVRDDRRVNVPAENVGNIDTLSGVFADDRLALLLISSVDLMSMNPQESFIVDGEDNLVGLEVVESQALVFC